MEKKSTVFFKCLSFILGLVNTLAFLSLRNCWSGMSGTLGYKAGKPIIIYYIPVGICVLFFAVFISEMILLAVRAKGGKWPVVYTVIEVVFSAVIAIVIMFGGQKYVRAALPHFFEGLAVAAAVTGIWFLLCVYPKTKLKDSGLFKVIVVAALVVAASLFLIRFGILRLTYEPVVYAVEDEYQIVFSGSTSALGSVTVGGKEYYDLYSGSERSKAKVHKVSVPMEALDRAGSYTINLQQVIYRGPFGGLLGKTIEKTYSFKPVDTSDGFKYLAFSDIHANKQGAVKTAKQVGDIDLLVIDGDTLSMIETFADANFINEVCFEITGGSIPVIYARGNHECKGDYSEELYRYVGSKNGDFYYSVSFGDVYVLVLDAGEDHDDDWWEYYGTAEYDIYRNEQLEFVKNEFERGEYLSKSYNMAVCHIPIVFVNSRHNHEDFKKNMTTFLNGMNIDMCLAAHQHELMIFEPGTVKPFEVLTYNTTYDSGTCKGYLTDFNFLSLMISKPGFAQDINDENEASHIGLVVEADLKEHIQKCYYVNSLGQKVVVVNPFANISYGDIINYAIHK